jgi:DNA-binding CsgD family transcriptional regulator
MRARSLLVGELALRRHDDPTVPTLTAALVDAHLAAGQLPEASALVSPDASVWRAPALPRGQALLIRASGLVARGQGDVPTSLSHLASALDLFVRLELPFDVGRTELELARLLAPADPQAAVARATAALRRLRALGARNEADASAALLRSLGVTPAAGPRAHETLTYREMDVIVLVAQGLTNRQIAERLYLSPRTVGNHVSSILRKLGLRSRSEAASYAARVPDLRRLGAEARG